MRPKREPKDGADRKGIETEHPPSEGKAPKSRTGRKEACDLLIIIGNTKTAHPIAMTTPFSDSALPPHSLGLAEVSNALVESALVVAAALFWAVAIPFVALSLMCVKIWDTLAALTSGAGVRPNPLILRRGLAKSTLTAVRSSPRATQI